MGSGGSRTKDRRYDAGAGRFISEDLIKGHTAVPYTMNHYSYIWQAFSNFGGVSVGGCVYIVADYASKKIFEGCPASE